MKWVLGNNMKDHLAEVEEALAQEGIGDPSVVAAGKLKLPAAQADDDDDGDLYSDVKTSVQSPVKEEHMDQLT
eukprot:14929136-Alexandrium_andersonii.AAC.1